MPKDSLDLAWVLLCSALMMLTQAGFCCLESGLVRSKNSINVSIKNLTDFCISSSLFWVVGFGLMFGATYGGWIGTSGFFADATEDPHLVAFIIFQMAFCGTATTLIAGAVAERMRFGGYLITAVLVSAIIYPIMGHWAWAGVYTGNPQGWLARRGFIDFAGSTVVHSTGGWVALAATIILGPRIGRFTRRGKMIQGHNLPMATIGVMILWFGWFGFNGGSTLSVDGRIPRIFLNTCLAAALGGNTSLLLSWILRRRPQVEEVINGVIAGLVGITACCHLATPIGAACVGIVGAAVCFSANAAFVRLKIDDVIGAVPAHACAGAWGTIAVALVADPGDWGTGLNRWQQLAVQLQGVAACFIWSFGVGFGALSLINRFIPLRVNRREERIGLNMAEHGASTEILELLTDMEEQRELGDFSSSVSVDPHTEIGQIAKQYNRVLKRVNEKTQKLVHANSEIHQINKITAEARDEAIAARTELQEKIRQLEEFNHVAIDREMRMIELKQEINELAAKIGEDPYYDLTFVKSLPNRDIGQ